MMSRLTDIFDFDGEKNGERGKRNLGLQSKLRKN